MRTLTMVLLITLSSGAGVVRAQAPAFDSGSDGSYGPMNITANTTLDVPSNGVFHCTTVSIAANVTLRFRPNALNTPVYLLAISNVTISGTIEISGASGNNAAGGAGGPGGFDGGTPAVGSLPPGAGLGPGAGRAGTTGTGSGSAGGGSFGSPGASASTNRGTVYGNPLLIPLIGGSGGGGAPGLGGGGGGGALLIASNTRIDFVGAGRILAQGGSTQVNNVNGGSAGAVRLVAPVVAAPVSASISVHPTGSGFVSGGGLGRVRVDTLDRGSFAASINPGGWASFGKVMQVFPVPNPRLDIIEAAGQAIPEGTPGPVTVLLPTGSPTNQIIKVQARDFIGVVPINVVLTPQHGTPSVYAAEIDLAAGNPAQVVVNVTLPVNVETAVNAWTR